jgi:hypothetical protein
LEVGKCFGRNLEYQLCPNGVKIHEDQQNPTAVRYGLYPDGLKKERIKRIDVRDKSMKTQLT